VEYSALKDLELLFNVKSVQQALPVDESAEFSRDVVKKLGLKDQVAKVEDQSSFVRKVFGELRASKSIDLFRDSFHDKELVRSLIPKLKSDTVTRGIAMNVLVRLNLTDPVLQKQMARAIFDGSLLLSTHIENNTTGAYKKYSDLIDHFLDKPENVRQTLRIQQAEAIGQIKPVERARHLGPLIDNELLPLLRNSPENAQDLRSLSVLLNVASKLKIKDPNLFKIARDFLDIDQMSKFQKPEFGQLTQQVRANAAALMTTSVRGEREALQAILELSDISHRGLSSASLYDLPRVELLQNAMKENPELVSAAFQELNSSQNPEIRSILWSALDNQKELTFYQKETLKKILATQRGKLEAIVYAPNLSAIHTPRLPSQKRFLLNAEERARITARTIKALEKAPLSISDIADQLSALESIRNFRIADPKIDYLVANLFNQPTIPELAAAQDRLAKLSVKTLLEIQEYQPLSDEARKAVLHFNGTHSTDRIWAARALWAENLEAQLEVAELLHQPRLAEYALLNLDFMYIKEDWVKRQVKQALARDPELARAAASYKLNLEQGIYHTPMVPETLGCNVLKATLLYLKR
jgi:hypothetical protein